METVPDSLLGSFVGEGRANVVFELQATEDRPGLQGQLLRLPKDKSEAMSYPELQTYWENEVVPLFRPNELVQQRLVNLPKSSSFFKALNDQLVELEAEGNRRHDFAGHRVSDRTRIGMLVEDMRPSKYQADAFTTLEIKPKWLHQSPRAPGGAERCRNCARKMQRSIQNKKRIPIFCPLNLVKVADFPRDQTVAKDFGRYLGLSEVESDNLRAWLTTSSLLQRLRKCQWEKDHEPSISDKECDQYRLAMTLRDCSLFVKIPCNPCSSQDQVVAKLADMDMKNIKVKKDYWEQTENELGEEHLYWNTDEVSNALVKCQYPFYKTNKNLPAEVRRYYQVAGPP